jgi:hypothetical protein
MLKRIKSALSKVKESTESGGLDQPVSGKGSSRRSGPSKELTHALFPLEAYDPELFRRVVDYVHSGDGP